MNIKAFVKNMTDEELDKFIEFLRSEKIKRNPQRNKNSTETENIYNVLVKCLVKNKLPKSPPFSIFIRNDRNRSAINNSLRNINSLLLEIEKNSIPLNLTKMERIAFYSKIIEISIQHLREINVIVSPRTIFLLSEKYGALLDKAYPGYGNTVFGLNLLLKRHKNTRRSSQKASQGDFSRNRHQPKG